MKNSNILLSLCIPTYGVMEWILPVLESIYSQNVDQTLFEVVVTDNGNNNEFFKKMQELTEKYKNLKYIKTESYSFLNEIDSYKNASGKFIKFINHRTKLKDNAINYFIEFVKNNEKEKPIVYFSNGVLKKKNISKLNTFDQYIKELGIYSSWSTGMAFWKEHFDAMKSHEEFNELFPHTDILFDRKNENTYIIDDTELLEEIPVGNNPKGKYDLFYAFGVEYISLLLDLYRSGFITIKTFQYVRNENLKFIRQLYYDFVFRKIYCSYDLSNFDSSIKIFYSKFKVKKVIPIIGAKRLLLKFIRILKKKK